MLACHAGVISQWILLYALELDLLCTETLCTKGKGKENKQTGERTSALQP
jgi:hypothetical protein